MMKHLQYIIIGLVVSLITACSTTNNLPEGEVLYTGVEGIHYNGESRAVTKKARKDSTGVIVAIAETAERIENLLNGNATNANAEQSDEGKNHSKKALLKKENQQDAAALEVAMEEVNAVLEYAPNNALFGSAYHRTPFPAGLWAYNKYVNKTGGFQKWMYKTFATDPICISNVNPDTRVKVAQNTLKNYGYFRGKVKYNIVPQGNNSRKAKISYDVNPGKVYRLDSISITGFTTTADSLIRKNQHKTLLHSGDPFSVLALSNEQARLEELFRNEGYYYYRSNFVTYKADTIMKPYKVQLQMQPEPNIRMRMMHPWYMGDVYVTIDNQRADSVRNELDIRSLHFNFSGKRIPVRPGVWIQNIAHRPGTLYRQSDQEATQANLSSLGLFTQYNLNYVPRDTSATCDTLDLYINALLDKPYTTDLEMSVTEKNADRIGPGLSLDIKKKNVFRGGEFLNWKLYGSYEWRTNGDEKVKGMFNSYEVGSKLSIDYSHIVFPGINRRTFRFPSKTSFALNADWLNRAQYFNLFSLGIKATYSWHKNATTRHELTPLSLSFDKLIRSNAEFDSIMAENPALYVSMRDRFVPSMQYTFTYQSAPSHRNPVWWQVSVKEAGNVTAGLYAIAGKSFNEKDKNLFKNPFAQYVKVSTELHNKFKISRSQSIVTRLAAGFVYSYGNADVAPYSDQFFVGGANSVRAFAIRSIGPGHYTARHSKYSYMDQTGDFKLEANAEYRFPIFGTLNGAVFLDAGNVWLLREDSKRPGGKLQASSLLKDLALGTGMGLRYDMEFLVLRLDLGVALHNPADTGKSGYYNIPKFKDGLALHFAIGYPF